MPFKLDEWADLTDEETIKKLESIEGLLSLDRNDPCWCGLGGKYKKCCEAQDRRIVMDAGLYEGVQFEDQVPPEEYLLGLEGDSLAQYEEIQDRIDQGEPVTPEDLSHLKQLSLSTPRSLFIKHLIVMTAERLGLKEEADAALADAKALLPDDLFTSILEARIVQSRGGSFLETLKNAQTLPEFWPERKSFAPFEVLTFHESLIEYYTEKRDYRGVQMHAQFLEFLFKDHPDLLESVREMAKRARIDRNAQILGSKLEKAAVD